MGHEELRFSHQAKTKLAFKHRSREPPDATSVWEVTTMVMISV